MPQIKPIETRYAGCRFRSRLEARWAIAFDDMGIKWNYELEGYDLGELGYYLPDFELPNFNQKNSNCNPFAEVKPNRLTEHELALVVALAEGTNRPVALLCGVPNNMGGYPFIKGRAHDGGLDIAGWLYVHPWSSEKAKSARFEHGESG